MRNLPEKLIRMIYPARCPVCDRPVQPFTASVCSRCADIPRETGENVCMKCGKGMGDPAKEYCADCRRTVHRFHRGAAVFTYRSIQAGIYRFKYSGRREYADYFGDRMAEMICRKFDPSEIDLLIPVPLAVRRKRQRGYNQAELLADRVSRKLKIPVEKEVLFRVKETVPMKNMDMAARRVNLKNAFHVYGNKVKLKSIMLVDDIYTTGATVDACAEVLLKAGASKVCFAMLAIGEDLDGE